jgi:hypothetical protein
MLMLLDRSLGSCILGREHFCAGSWGTSASSSDRACTFAVSCGFRRPETVFSCCFAYAVTVSVGCPIKV